MLDLAGAQKSRVERLSNIMAYYTLSNQAFDIKTILFKPPSMGYKIDSEKDDAGYYLGVSKIK